MAKNLRVLDTYIRALKGLVKLGAEVETLEAEVAGREAETLRDLLALLSPVARRLAKPIVLREPWVSPAGADAARGGAGRRDLGPAILLVNNFQQNHDPAVEKRLAHEAYKVLLSAEGRLFEVRESGRWLEDDPSGRDSSWQVEVRDILVTPEFAKRNLMKILKALLDALHEAVGRERENRRTLRERLALLEEASRTLRRPLPPA